MSAKKKAGKMTKSFEEALAELEDVVGKLEAGEAPLEESLGLYERGVAAFKRCHELLAEAERKIEKLAPGGRGTEPFGDGESGDKGADIRLAML